MRNKIIEFNFKEPLKSNRWLIRTYPTQIHPYLFRKYKLYNEGETIILTTEFMETVQVSYNPKDLLEITDIRLEYLDPVGEVVSGLNMIVKGINFEKKHSYKKDKLLLTKMRFVIDIIEPIFSNTQINEVKDGEQRAS